MSAGGWPQLPGQCPRCAYLHPTEPPYRDDSGYEIVGFCRHPRIGMELFRAQTRAVSARERCPFFALGSTTGTETRR
jgi:hypothetical protein